MADPKSLSDEELLKMAHSDDNSHAHLSDEEVLHAAGITDKYPAYESAGYGAAQGLTLGYLPQLMAAAKTRSVSNSDYIAERDRQIADLAAMKAEDPASFTVGELGGSLALPIGVFGKAAKGATTLGRLAMQGGAAGILQGALQNPGDHPGQLSGAQFDDRANSAAMGALYGGAGGATIPVIVRGIQKGAQALRSKAGDLAFKAAGPYARDARKAYAKDQISSIGQEMLDQDIIGNIPRGYETLEKRAASSAEKKGAEKGAIIKQLGEFEKKLAQEADAADGQLVPRGTPLSTKSGSKVGVSREAIANELEKDLLVPTNLPGAGKINAEFQTFIDDFRKGGKELIPLEEADQMKIFLGQRKNKLINYDRLPGSDIPNSEHFYRSLSAKLNQGVDDAASTLAEKFSPEIALRLAAAKKGYGAAKTVQSMASQREAREFANRLISPSDYGTGSAAGLASMVMHGNPVEAALAGIVAGGANKLARKYGNQLSAKQLDNLSKALASIQPGSKTAVALGVGAAATSRDKKEEERKRRLKALED